MSNQLSMEVPRRISLPPQDIHGTFDPLSHLQDIDCEAFKGIVKRLCGSAPGNTGRLYPMHWASRLEEPGR